MSVSMAHGEPNDVLEVARRLVESLGGRFSRELGIDVDVGGPRVDEWFLAATLFGTRIAARTAMRTYLILADAGVRTLANIDAHSWDDLVRLLDAGGYARYDFRTASRLQQLAVEVDARFGGSVCSLRTVVDPNTLESALDALPGWGPTTVRIFLRELRGVWPGAQTLLDERSLRAASHLSIAMPRQQAAQLDVLRDVSNRAGLDVRDLEAGLVRCALAHRDMRTCPGDGRCRALTGAMHGWLANPTPIVVDRDDGCRMDSVRSTKVPVAPVTSRSTL
jgi:hypothetical protein